MSRCAARFAGCTAAGFVSAVATGSRAPGCGIPLHRALHYGRVVDTHPGADGAALEAHGVKVVLAAAFIIDTTGNLCGARWLRANTLRSLEYG